MDITLVNGNSPLPDMTMSPASPLFPDNSSFFSFRVCDVSEIPPCIKPDDIPQDIGSSTPRVDNHVKNLNPESSELEQSVESNLATDTVIKTTSLNQEVNSNKVCLDETEMPALDLIEFSTPVLQEQQESAPSTCNNQLTLLEQSLANETVKTPQLGNSTDTVEHVCKFFKGGSASKTAEIKTDVPTPKATKSFFDRLNISAAVSPFSMLSSALQNLKINDSADETFLSCSPDVSWLHKTVVNEDEKSDKQKVSVLGKTSVVGADSTFEAASDSLEQSDKKEVSVLDKTVVVGADSTFEATLAQRDEKVEMSSVNFDDTQSYCLEKLHEVISEDLHHPSLSYLEDDSWQPGKYENYFNMKLDVNHLQQEIATKILELKKKERTIIEMFPDMIKAPVMRSKDVTELNTVLLKAEDTIAYLMGKLKEVENQNVQLKSDLKVYDNLVGTLATRLNEKKENIEV